MKILNLKQRSEEWFAARKGKITGSIAANFFKSTKKDWIYKIVAEKITTLPEGEENAAARGTRLEPEAVEAFEKVSGLKVEDVGFVVSDEYDFIGLSPDGLIKDKDGNYIAALETKCLAGYKQVRAFIEKKVPKEYHAQVDQYFLLVPTLEVVYFNFYHDDMPDHMKTIIVPVTREEREEFINKQLELFTSVDEEVNSLLDQILL